MFGGIGFAGAQANLDGTWVNVDFKLRVIKYRGWCAAINDVLADNGYRAGKVGIWGEAVAAISVDGEAANGAASDVSDGG